jgi:hypothetical protein
LSVERLAMRDVISTDFLPRVRRDSAVGRHPADSPVFLPIIFHNRVV